MLITPCVGSSTFVAEKCTISPVLCEVVRFVCFRFCIVRVISPLVFASKFKFRSHLIKIRTRTKSFQCGTCLLEFSSQKTLNLHEYFHNQIIATPKIFKCKLCARTFTKSNALDEHMETHGNKIRFRCEKCLMVFVDKRKLKLHETKKHKKNCSF